MSNHTAGPWRANGTHLLGSIVADVPTGETNIDKPDHVEAYQGYLIAESVLPQNRPLIAAAPELLEAARSFLDVMVADDFECTCSPGDTCPLCRTKAAIAKAEGRTC